MVNITEEHLHHMARRHHATMKKLDGIREKQAGLRERLGRLGSTAEFGAGAWVGGILEGRTGGAAIGPLPVNLGVGLALVTASHFKGVEDKLGRLSNDMENVGNGFIGSWAAATGYAFGKRWKESGKVFGGGVHPWAHPYEAGLPPSP